MRRPISSAILLLTCMLLGCGGGTAASKAPAAAETKGSDDGAPDPSIGSAVAAQGGLPSLGGAGNREGDPPAAVNTTFRADLAEKGAPVKLDGVPGEWPACIAVKQVVRGSAAGTAFDASLQYDDAKIYIAGEA